MRAPSLNPPRNNAEKSKRGGVLQGASHTHLFFFLTRRCRRRLGSHAQPTQCCYFTCRLRCAKPPAQSNAKIPSCRSAACRCPASGQDLPRSLLRLLSQHPNVPASPCRNAFPDPFRQQKRGQASVGRGFCLLLEGFALRCGEQLLLGAKAADAHGDVLLVLRHPELEGFVLGIWVLSCMCRQCPAGCHLSEMPAAGI